MDRAQYISGVTIVAVPQFNAKGAMTHGLVAVGISEQVEAAGISNIAEAMLSARNRLSEMLVAG